MFSRLLLLLSYATCTFSFLLVLVIPVAIFLTLMHQMQTFSFYNASRGLVQRTTKRQEPASVTNVTEKRYSKSWWSLSC